MTVPRTIWSQAVCETEAVVIAPRINGRIARLNTSRCGHSRGYMDDWKGAMQMHDAPHRHGSRRPVYGLSQRRRTAVRGKLDGSAIEIVGPDRPMLTEDLKRSGHLGRSSGKRKHHCGIARGAILVDRWAGSADVLRVLTTMMEQRTWRNGEHQECHQAPCIRSGFPRGHHCGEVMLKRHDCSPPTVHPSPV